MTRIRLLCTVLMIVSVSADCGWLSTASADDWPQWQGVDRNAISKERGLLQEWPTDGPPLAWKGTGLGKGMGGIAVSGGRIYTTGDDADKTAWLHAFNESDGKSAWSVKIGPGGNPGNIFKPFGPRATPTVEGDRLYILSQTGDLVCFSIDKGKEIWRVNYIQDFGGINPVWGFSESPLIDGDKIICTPGAEDAVLMALEKQTGKPIWKCKVPEGPTGNRGFLGTSGAAYASALAIDFEGVRQYVQLTATTLVGVAATDGKLLWRYDRASNTHRINCTTPIYHDGIVYTASAYDAGGGALKLSKDASGAITAKEVFFTPKMKNHHGGMMIVEDCLYSTTGGNEGGFLFCFDRVTGKDLWSERKAQKGSLMLADERLYLRTERGEMILFEPNRERFVERGRF
ncbi:MAG: hypothetical protein FD138_1953, partial [Planctomycetota bacterium]